VAKSIHSTVTSLDGYIADKDGTFDKPPFRALRIIVACWCAWTPHVASYVLRGDNIEGGDR
jgi:hypothetical protein